MQYAFFPFFLILSLFAAGCSQRDSDRHYDGKALFQQQCVSCHNAEMPPVTAPDEAAPPMMAVAFHVKDFMQVDNPAEKRPRFIAFVTDYALHPSAEKSFCDAQSLESYGLMPSLEGRITRPELEAVAAYVYDTYTKEAFLQRMEEANAFAMLPEGEQIARRNGCFVCHDTVLQKVGPPFTAVAERYADAETIAEGIRNGSRGKWEASRNVPMPAIRVLDAEQLSTLSHWIAGLKR